jgi:signal transduction histidine kinase
MVAPQINAKKLRLEVSATPPDLTFAADEDKVRQILINLLGNALKFTPEGGTISVAAAHNENEVAIHVRDTGIGVPGEHLERIFEPFMQSKRALNTSDQGVGLGLAISRQLARAMRGDLTVQSTVGKGSTFTLTLPRRALSAS